MFAPWIRRSALKRKPNQSALLLPAPNGPGLILLLSLLGVFIAVGIFVMQQTYAAGTLFSTGH